MLYFFTVWNILFLVFHQVTSKHFDLLYMSFIVMTVGLYLSFVNPKYFVWSGGNMIKDWKSKIVIDIVHVVMFLFAMFFIKKPRHHLKLINTLLVMILYISLVDPEKVYKVKLEEILLVISLFTIIYLFI